MGNVVKIIVPYLPEEERIRREKIYHEACVTFMKKVWKEREVSKEMRI